MVVRSLASTSSAVKPSPARVVGRSGGDALRTGRRIPDGPSLAYFMESNSPNNGSHRAPGRGKLGWLSESI